MADCLQALDDTGQSKSEQTQQKRHPAESSQILRRNPGKQPRNNQSEAGKEARHNAENEDKRTHRVRGRLLGSYACRNRYVKSRHGALRMLKMLNTKTESAKDAITLGSKGNGNRVSNLGLMTGELSY